MGKKIGVAVVGCGRIAKSHLAAIKTLSNLIELVATVDVDEGRAQNACVENAAKKYYVNTSEAFANPEIEAVVLCLPHHLHCEVAVEAARAGIHILVEKPMALTVAEADMMIEEAEKSEVNLMVGQVLRHTPGIVKAKECFEQGILGKPLHVTERRLGYIAATATDWWRSNEKTGGLIIGLNIPHSTDTILWMLNTSAFSVYAVGNSNNPTWEGEDDVLVQLMTKEGTIVCMNHSFNARGVGGDTIIIGTDSTFRVTHDSFAINGKNIELPKPELTAMEAQMEEFIKSINEEREPLASGRDVRKVVAVIEAARESMRKRMPIYLS